MKGAKGIDGRPGASMEPLNMVSLRAQLRVRACLLAVIRLTRLPCGLLCAKVKRKGHGAIEVATPAWHAGHPSVHSSTASLYWRFCVCLCKHAHVHNVSFCLTSR